MGIKNKAISTNKAYTELPDIMKNKATLNSVEKFHKSKQTPITPESLEGIGFERTDLRYMLGLNLGMTDIVYYYEGRNKGFWLNNSHQRLHFTSTEQLTEWLKPFQSTVAEEVG